MEGDSSLLQYSVLEFGLLFWLVALYLFFIVSSLAITRSRVSRLQELAEHGVGGAARALAAVRRSESFLLCAQTGRFMSALLTGVTLGHLLRKVFLTSVPMNLEPWSGALVCGLAVILFGIATLIAVQVAKAVTLQHPERVLSLVAAPLSVAHSLMGPMIGMLNRWIVGILTAFNLKVIHERGFALSTDDLTEMVKSSGENGAIPNGEREVIERLAGFSDTVVREVMTPRQDIVAIKVTDSMDEVIAVLSRERLSRLLVTGDEIDDVRGIVLAKDLVHLIGRGMDGLHPSSFLRPAHFVPNTRKVDDLFHELRREAKHFAVVLDEHGSVDGVVTVEDLLEELVGEIFDEYDSPSEEGGAERLPSGELVMNGGYLLDDLNTRWNQHLPAGDYDTVAGLILAKLGRIPVKGETIKINGVTLFVEELARNRIKRVRLAATESNSQSEQPADPASLARISHNA